VADKPPDKELLAELAAWRPPRGVISLYLRTDPDDPRQGWRTELRDGLKRLVEGGAGEGADHRAALRASAERITGRFPSGRHPGGRLQLGFVEVAEQPGREIWRSLQFSTQGTSLLHRERPYVRPLVELLDDGAPVGVIAVSAEHVRLLEWSLGIVEEIKEFSPSFMKRLWRERRGPRQRDIARGQVTTSAGKDQIDQRLEANRERFLHQTGRKIRTFLDRRRWRLLLAFGDRSIIGDIADGLGQRPELRVAGEENLMHAERLQLADKIEEAVRLCNRERERELVSQATDAALAANGRGSLGVEETMRALEQGRVEHLVLAAERPVDVDPPAHPNQAGDGNVDPIGDAVISERMIEQALMTSAAVTTVEGEAAAELARHGGVGALLRY